MKKKIGFIWKLLVILALIAAPLTYSSVLHTSKTSSGKTFVTIDAVDAISGADYTYTNPNADIAFALALNALPATGGTLDVLSTGTVQFATPLTVTKANVVINGSGKGTAFTAGGAAAPFIASANGLTLENCSFDVAPNMGSTTGWLWSNVTIGTQLWAIRTIDSASNPTGRAASYVIAAYNSNLADKISADIILTQHQDLGAVLNAEITAMPSWFGNIYISAGEYELSTSIVLPNQPSGDGGSLAIKGAGLEATRIALTGNVDMFTTSGTDTFKGQISDMYLFGNAKSQYAFNGRGAFLAFDNCKIDDFAAGGLYFNTNIDSNSKVKNCWFGRNGIDILFLASSGFDIYNNEFGGGSAVHIQSIGSTSVIRIHDNSFGGGAANCKAINLSGGYSWSILNNFFQMPTGNIYYIYLTTDNTSNQFIKDISIRGNQFLGQSATPNTPFIYLSKGTKDFENVQITENLFSAFGTTIPEFIYITGAGGTYVSGINISNNQIESVSSTVTNGFIKTNGNIRLSKDTKIFNNFSDTSLATVTNCNPFGLLVNPWATGWNGVGWIDGSYDGVSAASTDYYVQSSPIMITSTGGTGVSITIKDGSGNTIISGLTTLTMQRLPLGYSINFGAYSVAPTVTVWGE